MEDERSAAEQGNENEEDGPKSTEAVFKAHGEALDKFEADIPDEAQRADVLEKIIEAADLPENLSEVTPEQFVAVYDGYVRHIQEEITGPLGLDYETWMEHLDPAHYSALYRMALKGDWGPVRAHAKAVKDQMWRHPDWYR